MSVIVPCKSNERTIRATVESLLAQDYPALEEVILVGSIGDSTWSALRGIADPRLAILEVEPTPGRRDPNVKRDQGIRHARGEVLAMVDSDIVMATDWVSRGLYLLDKSGTECVAGGMRSIHDSFWGRYVDGTRMGAKTPRVGAQYLVTSENFGKRGMKPPITANVLFTRRLYEACPLDIRWSYGYEDYEWFWRSVRAGYPVLFSDELHGLHHHRRGLIPLGREYLRSSDGCAHLIRAHPDCPLARKRWRQAVMIPVAVFALAALAGVSLATDEGVLALGGLSTLAASGAAWEYSKQRKLESLLHPFITCVFASLYIFGLLRGMRKRSSGQRAERPGVPVPESTR